MTTEREAFEVWVKPFAYSHCETESLRSAWHDAWQASRKAAITDVMVVATVGATYPELMEYMQGELK